MSIDKCDVDADVVIDFSNAKAVDGVLDYCVDKQVPVVLCTTGLSDEQLAKVEECYKKVAVPQVCKHVAWHKHSYGSSQKGCTGFRTGRL